MTEIEQNIAAKNRTIVFMILPVQRDVKVRIEMIGIIPLEVVFLHLDRNKLLLIYTVISYEASKNCPPY